MRSIRYRAGFATVAFLMLLTAFGAPVAAGSAAVELNLVDYEHNGHCHVSDCEATSFAGHVGPVLPGAVALPLARQAFEGLELEETSASGFSEPVPTPPPIV